MAASPALPASVEEIPCLLCGADRGHVVTRARDLNLRVDSTFFRLVRCGSCGLSYFNPRPRREEMGKYYPAGYSGHAEIEGRKDQVLGRRSRRFDPVAGLSPGRCLDVGCGSGAALLRLQSRGWQVAGFEVSEAAARAGRAAGLDIRSGRELSDAAFPASSFDLVTLFCVLPHVHDPVSVLREVGRLLRPGGRLLMTVPNLDSLNFMLFRGRWYHLEPPRHLFFFSQRNLRVLARRTGFEWEGRRFRSGGGGFKRSLRLLGRESPIGGILADAAELRPARWLVRFAFRWLVDSLALGDTVDCWWRRR
jgi:SAM-dependent methyltransferase